MENLHPIFVHFPIALLMTAFLLETLALLFKRDSWHRLSLWNLSLGALGAIGAVLTGRQAEETAKHSFEIFQVMDLHEKLGYGILGTALFLAVWRLAAKDKLGKRARWISWGLLAALCGVVAFSAHLGGRLVYEFGVGGGYGRSSGIQVVR